MSEITESYEEIVKRLKPFDIIVDKISDEKYVTLKVVDDPNRINGEPTLNSCDPQQQEEAEDEEEEFEIDLTEAEAKASSDITDDCRQYLCFFCKLSIVGYSEALIHYQLHIDYYPIQCSVCDEANTDVLAFAKHCRSFHPELEKAKYISKVNSVFFNWIHNFLTRDPSLSVFTPHKYCPVCDWTHMINQPEEAAPKAIPILRHIHEHIQYMPFDCIKCRENGLEFRIHYLDYATRSHIINDHKELELEPPFWQHFSKRFTIPSLDKFIANYLTILGIKMPQKKRNIRRKNKPIAPPITSNGQTSQPKSSINSLQMLTNQIAIKPKPVPITINSSPIVLKNLLLSTNQLISNQAIVTQTFVGGKPVVTINRPAPQTYSSNPLQMLNPLLILPSNDKLNIKPQYVESTDLGIFYVDPKIVEIDEMNFKYICIFCDEEKISKIEMCLHYSIHLSYYPVVCMLCEKPFLDLSTLGYHYIKSHEECKNNLFHYFKENEKIEKWIDSFVDFQKTHDFKGNVSASFGDHCFVCQKLAKKESIGLSCDKNKIDLREHIHQHLHYFPYKCLVCFHGNRVVRFSSLNASAVTHITTFHDISDKNLLNKLIAKTDEILDLEKFIDSRLFPKREKTTETPIILNLKRKLEEIEIENKKRLEGFRHSISNPLPLLPSAQVLPMVRFENKSQTSISDKPSNSLLKISSISSPHKPNNGLKTIRVTPTPVKQIEYIPNRETYREPYLLCFHCHTKVSNTKELESHHNNKHPKLTIASYAPTKRTFPINF